MGPLQGLRVVEFAGIGPAPLCCMLLADLGADVVRIDRLQASGLGVAIDKRFDVNARGRRSVALDLKAPAGRDAALRVVLDNTSALQLLSPHYSANAFAFATQFQNCNQWVAEMLAAAFGQPATATPRQQAQAWLQEQGYEPTVFDVGWRVLMWLSGLSPWLHHADHPSADLEAQRFRVSMPAALEAFVRQRWPQAQRIEFCHTDQQVVVRRGWQAINAGCQAEAGDTVLALD
jgi:hypothetical protein